MKEYNVSTNLNGGTSGEVPGWFSIMNTIEGWESAGNGGGKMKDGSWERCIGTISPGKKNT